MNKQRIKMINDLMEKVNDLKCEVDEVLQEE